ncbi:MAG: hypothetical protein HY561_11285 [Gemmatimonadetes bacterium]|nr:hypothetical protein [Gemmatimonadota bacterium]
MFFALAAAALTVVAGLLLRRRLQTMRAARLSDDLIRQIEERGSIEVDEPLDLDAIRAEEEQFWGETWDEPEEE